MSGIGKRFIDAGYKTPKPLIEIDGKPIIQHVVELFPGETKFTFICNENHIADTNMREVLTSLVSNANIVTIPKHKLGPVFAVQEAYHLIEDDEEVIVNYCDFGTYWNYEDFLSHTRSRSADGAVPAYRNFHPHMLGSTNYAFMRDDNQWMLEIQEKKPFTNDRMLEYASNGTYYFRTGSILKRYFNKTIDSGESLNGEFYVSVVYNRLVQAGLTVSIYEIQHMLQWGTPQDVTEYLAWSKYFASNQSFLSRDRSNVRVDNLIIPMAGEGSRFKNEGFKKPKPFIKVNGKPMVDNAIASLPSASRLHLAIRENHLDASELLTHQQSGAEITPISSLTDGQATTCKYVIDRIPDNKNFIIAACDNAIIWDDQKLQELLDDEVDVIVWGFKNHPHANQNPEQYGWIETRDNDVTNVSVKQPISKMPELDFGVVGAFYFRNKTIFLRAYEAMIKCNQRVNGEFYIDSLINFIDRKLSTVKIIPVDQFVCWGTPNDYKTFKYWQSYFHKSDSHSYNINNDDFVTESEKSNLIHEYTKFDQRNR